MEKHIELTNALQKHLDENQARLATVKAQLSELLAQPRADASIWEREGKTGTTYYLVHRQGSPRFEAGECKRREKIGIGDSAKQKCQDQIQRNADAWSLIARQEQLEAQYSSATKHIRSAINVLGFDQPDGVNFRRHYY